MKGFLIFGALLGACSTVIASEAHMRAFGPQSVVRVARPTVRWEVWPGKGSAVTDSMMTLNGREVRPKYNADGKVLEYTPPQPLEPGTYRVACKVVVDDFMPVTKSWDFKVATEASTRLPQPSANQLKVVNAVNEIRSRIGLPPFEVDDRLCAAANTHTNYLKRNGLTGHYQRPDDPGFLGQTPSDRLNAFGYTDGSWEGVDFGSQSVQQSIRRLYDAPYHRLPFLQPGTTSIGTGFLPSHTTLEFGMSDASGTVVSPAPQERDVPVSWRGPERPDPLAIHGLSGVVGYPIVFAYFTPQGERIYVEKARLSSSSGEKIPFALNTPDNDEHLDFAAFLIPRQPLKPYTTYEVTVEAKTKSGKDVSTSWRFTTGVR